MDIVVLIEGVHNDRGPIEGTSILNSIDPICSTVTLLKDTLNILVDTGYRGYERELLACLRAESVRPEDIDVIVNTHSHFDHCYNNHLFLNARVIHGRNVLSPKKLNVVKEVAIPGVTIMSTPGHYPDHQSVVVHTDRTYVIAGDAVREDIIRDEQRWQMVANDEYVQSVKRIFAVADVVIPGHGHIIQGDVLYELRSILATR